MPAFAPAPGNASMGQSQSAMNRLNLTGLGMGPMSQTEPDARPSSKQRLGSKGRTGSQGRKIHTSEIYTHPLEQRTDGVLNWPKFIVRDLDNVETTYIWDPRTLQYVRQGVLPIGERIILGEFKQPALIRYNGLSGWVRAEKNGSYYIFCDGCDRFPDGCTLSCEATNLFRRGVDGTLQQCEPPRNDLAENIDEGEVLPPNKERMIKQIMADCEHQAMQLSPLHRKRPEFMFDDQSFAQLKMQEGTLTGPNMETPRAEPSNTASNAAGVAAAMAQGTGAILAAAGQSSQGFRDVHRASTRASMAMASQDEEGGGRMSGVFDDGSMSMGLGGASESMRQSAAQQPPPAQAHPSQLDNHLSAEYEKAKADYEKAKRAYEEAVSQSQTLKDLKAARASAKGEVSTSKWSSSKQLQAPMLSIPNLPETFRSSIKKDVPQPSLPGTGDKLITSQMGGKREGPNSQNTMPGSEPQVMPGHVPGSVLGSALAAHNAYVAASQQQMVNHQMPPQQNYAPQSQQQLPPQTQQAVMPQQNLSQSKLDQSTRSAVNLPEFQGLGVPSLMDHFEGEKRKAEEAREKAIQQQKEAKERAEAIARQQKESHARMRNSFAQAMNDAAARAANLGAGTSSLTLGAFGSGASSMALSKQPAQSAFNLRSFTPQVVRPALPQTTNLGGSRSMSPPATVPPPASSSDLPPGARVLAVIPRSKEGGEHYYATGYAPWMSGDHQKNKNTAQEKWQSANNKVTTVNYISKLRSEGSKEDATAGLSGQAASSSSGQQPQQQRVISQRVIGTTLLPVGGSAVSSGTTTLGSQNPKLQPNLGLGIKPFGLTSSAERSATQGPPKTTTQAPSSSQQRSQSSQQQSTMPGLKK